MPRKFAVVTLAIAALLPITACGPRSESDWLGGYRPGWRDENAYPIGDRPRSQQEQWQRRQLGDVCCNNNVQREPEWNYAPEAQRVPPEQVLSEPRYGGASQTVNAPQYSEPVQTSTEPSFANQYP
ncbi:MAG TPA: hypothetical protein IGS53_04800 [Leptolyngbyaceae cyanobacterium M33_DOE_097]|uniref:Lipoprotein n=1 Tax=Oscillatoriales cyanobacterium SpSt-418 TaxID=2282169 RepID=A0A7C3KE83_9CYAN|nr:hypothetical protein [Leptolyngbyaceae cyanobacterium M33_DOE_097]